MIIYIFPEDYKYHFIFKYISIVLCLYALKSLLSWLETLVICLSGLFYLQFEFLCFFFIFVFLVSFFFPLFCLSSLGTKGWDSIHILMFICFLFCLFCFSILSAYLFSMFICFNIFMSACVVIFSSLCFPLRPPTLGRIDCLCLLDLFRSVALAESHILWNAVLQFLLFLKRLLNDHNHVISHSFGILPVVSFLIACLFRENFKIGRNGLFFSPI